jgi:hypothetical protein
MWWIILSLACLAAGFINALRGGGLGWLRWVLGAFAGGLNFVLSQDLLHAATVGLGVAVFMTQPWGRWYLFDKEKRLWSGEPNRYEAVVESVFDRYFPQRETPEVLAWTTSATLFSAPLALFMLNPLYLLLGPLLVAVYYSLHRLDWVGLTDRLWFTHGRIRVSEFAFGVLLGVFVVLMA